MPETPQPPAGIDRWELPSLNGDDDAMNLTAAKLEDIRQAAWQEGFEQGKKAGFDAGFQQGLDRGAQEVQAQAARLAQMIRQLDTPLTAMEQESLEHVLAMIKSLAFSVLQKNIRESDDWLQTLVQRCLAVLDDNEQPVTISVSETDYEILKQQGVFDAESFRRCRFVPHATLTPGGCIVQSPPQQIDMTLEQQWQQVLENLEETLAGATACDPGGLENSVTGNGDQGGNPTSNTRNTAAPNARPGDPNEPR